MLEKILVPLDGSDLAEGILPYVSHLAKGLGARVTLISVVNPEAIEVHAEPHLYTEQPDIEAEEEAARPGSTPHDHHEPQNTHVHQHGGRFASQLFESAQQRVSEMLQKVVDRLASDGVQCDSRVVLGNAAEEIVSVAESEGYDVIAMSTRARSALTRGILGSVTDKIIHLSSIPVLTIRPEEAEQYKDEGASIGSIMVPLDGSELSERALPYAEHLAQRLSLKLILTRAISLVAFTSPVDEYGYTSASHLDEHLEHTVSAYLNEIADRLRAKGLEVECRALAGSPAYAIVDLARETPQGMIVMSTRGRSGFKRLLLGSVTERVVRSSGDPVLIIPPAESNA